MRDERTIKFLGFHSNSVFIIELIIEREGKVQEFLAKDEKTYYIDMDDGQDIRVFDNNKNNVGSITLMHVDSEDYKISGYFYLQHLGLDNCKGLGIGTEVFRLHNEMFGEPIVAASEFGPQMDDGSHLIDDGIPFVAKMREKGFICSDSNNSEDEYD